VLTGIAAAIYAAGGAGAWPYTLGLAFGAAMAAALFAQ